MLSAILSRTALRRKGFGDYMAKVVCPWDLISDFVTDAFVGYGVPREDALVCTDVLLESDKRGIESHGCNRFKPIYIDRIKAGIQNPVTEFEVLRETATTAVVDGHDGMGQVIGVRAMQMAIDKAKKYGMGMVAVRNSCHYGIAGYYVTMATQAGMVGMTGTNARPSIAPTHGVENMLGTNPFTIGMPTDEKFPFVFDAATSIIQRGRIEYYARIGKDCPVGTVVGRDGSALTNSEEILTQLNTHEAALAPLGGIGEELGAMISQLRWSCFRRRFSREAFFLLFPESAKTEKKRNIISAIGLSQLIQRRFSDCSPLRKRQAIF